VTLLCVPIFVESIDAALADAAAAKAAGADIVELRIDTFFSGPSGSDTDDAYSLAQLRRLLAECPLPVILTCRSAAEGGHYDADDSSRVSLLEDLCAASDHPPAYLDFELSAYQRSANLRQKINLCVTHPKQLRDTTTRLILSIHDFDSRPADLDRRLLAAYSEPACAVVKVAYRARSLRDNLDLFDLTTTAPKPTIALGMGEFGLPSRVLASKFNAFLTFASLRDSAATAPGQPTIHDLLHLYRFRSITPATRLFGVVGWPVAHSMSPLIHNAAFTQHNLDAVYLPLPIAADGADHAASRTSLFATLSALADHPRLNLSGVSVTLPHKEHAAAWALDRSFTLDPSAHGLGAINTLDLTRRTAANTDALAIASLLTDHLGPLSTRTIAVVGAGGVARAAAFAAAAQMATVVISSRDHDRAQRLAHDVNAHGWGEGRAVAAPLQLLPRSCADAFINCTPVGMAGGPAPDALSIPLPDLQHATPDTLFFDTVYNPIDTPMLRAARQRGCRTIDGVEMFTRQAAAQFALWTGTDDTATLLSLFDRLVRARLTPPASSR
jgi:3-dehydroquinate dehydratase/shikimate dehydrogenase